MRREHTAILLAVSSLAAAADALANPDGAPWGSADPEGAQNCASCHFDSEPVMNSPILTLNGMPEIIVPGMVYDLVLRFANPPETIAGFQASASAGTFLKEGEGLEANDREIRSTAPLAIIAEWQMRWQAPETNDTGRLMVHVAANAANGDDSPFGDIIHFKTIYAVAGKN